VSTSTLSMLKHDLSELYNDLPLHHPPSFRFTILSGLLRLQSMILLFLIAVDPINLREEI
jgi:hypothetical protein